MCQQAIDLHNQWLPLKRYAAVQFAAAPLLQLGDLLSHLLQRPQCATYRIALGQQNQQQSGRPQPQTKPLQATETLQDGGVVLRHGEGKRLTETAEGGAVNQQALSLRP